MNLIGEGGVAHCQLRYYTCAPTSYILIGDDRALVEQYHYGKARQRADSRITQLHLTEEMPLVEYQHPQSTLFAPKQGMDPLAVIEDHFRHVFDYLARDPTNEL